MSTICINISHPFHHLTSGRGKIAFFDNHITRRSLGSEKWEENVLKSQNKDNERHMYGYKAKERLREALWLRRLF